MRLKSMKQSISRLLALLLAMTLFFAAAPVAMAAESGSCGDNLTWTFADGKLTISGSGVMTNYTEHSMPPWYSFRDQILWLSLPAGLTHVGNMAFYKCENLESVAMPSTVTSIGDLAFSQNRGMTMLSLNNGLKTIGRSAFESCESLQDVYIPGSVSAIGNRAFFLCEALRYVSVPSSVTDMGSNVFGYCGNLLGADVNASVNTLPSGTFLGCDSLQNVAFGGSPVSVAAVKQGGNGNTGSSAVPEPISPILPGNPVPDSSAGITQPPNQPSTPTDNQTPNQPSTPAGNQTSNQSSPPAGNQTQDKSASSVIIQNENNSDKLQVSTTTQNENSTINSEQSVTLGDNGLTAKTEITATVRDPEGWNDVVTEIKEAEKGGNGSDTVDVTVFVTNEPEVPKEVVEELAGKNVVLNVQTQTGSKYKVVCKDLSKSEIETGVDFSYIITTAEEVPEEFAGLKVYSLRFSSTVKVNAEVLIRLPNETPRRSAALYQLGSDGKPMHLVSAVVDDESYAHFYLSSVDEKTEYLIAMDVPGPVSAQAIIPENLYDEYTLVDQATGKAYVVTGRTSSWNMGLGKVMTILAVVMVSMVVIVGFVMYAWNKRRLKMGYVPDLSEEDYM